MSEPNTINDDLIAAAPLLLDVCKEFLKIIKNSHGIAGWHRNGDLAEWDWFQDDIDRLYRAIETAEPPEAE